MSYAPSFTAGQPCTCIFVVPGFVTWMTPPQLHINLQFWFSVGKLPISTVGLPGTHGAVVTGMHGIGVRTPRAAAVAAATVGFANELHMPNGIIFFIGTLSIIFAIGIVVVTLFSGVVIKTEGAMPKLHISEAPPHTHIAIIYSPIFPFSRIYFPNCRLTVSCACTITFCSFFFPLPSPTLHSRPSFPMS